MTSVIGKRDRFLSLVQGLSGDRCVEWLIVLRLTCYAIATMKVKAVIKILEADG